MGRWRFTLSDAFVTDTVAIERAQRFATWCVNRCARMRVASQRTTELRTDTRLTSRRPTTSRDLSACGRAHERRVPNMQPAKQRSHTCETRARASSSRPARFGRGRARPPRWSNRSRRWCPRTETRPSGFLAVREKIPWSVTRDPKGIYRRAASGDASTVPGVQASYEAPEHADLVVSGSSDSSEKAQVIIGALEARICQSCDCPIAS
jgi:adenylylsulfate kinase